MVDMMDKITGAIDQMTYSNDELFEGEVACECGEVHTYEEIKDGCKCKACDKDLSKELF